MSLNLLKTILLLVTNQVKAVVQKRLRSKVVKKKILEGGYTIPWTYYWHVGYFKKVKTKRFISAKAIALIRDNQTSFR